MPDRDDLKKLQRNLQLLYLWSGCPALQRLSGWTTRLSQNSCCKEHWHSILSNLNLKDLIFWLKISSSGKSGKRVPIMYYLPYLIFFVTQTTCGASVKCFSLVSKIPVSKSKMSILHAFLWINQYNLPNCGNFQIIFFCKLQHTTKLHSTPKNNFFAVLLQNQCRHF